MEKIKKVFYTTKDIMELTGYGYTKARAIKKQVVEYSQKKGTYAIGNDRCVATDFHELFGI